MMCSYSVIVVVGCWCCCSGYWYCNCVFVCLRIAVWHMMNTKRTNKYIHPSIFISLQNSYQQEWLGSLSPVCSVGLGLGLQQEQQPTQTASLSGNRALADTTTTLAKQGEKGKVQDHYIHLTRLQFTAWNVGYVLHIFGFLIRQPINRTRECGRIELEVDQC